MQEIEGCVKCDWKVFCGGGCSGSAQDLTSKGEYCKYTQAMLTYISKKIPLIHEQKLVKKIFGRR